MLSNIPKYIGGARALYISKSVTGFDNVVRNGVEILIEYICVCRYDDAEGFYLFGCDRNFNTHTDFYYEELDEAMDDAKRLYQTDYIIWTQMS